MVRDNCLFLNTIFRFLLVPPHSSYLWLCDIELRKGKQRKYDQETKTRLDYGNSVQNELAMNGEAHMLHILVMDCLYIWCGHSNTPPSRWWSFGSRNESHFFFMDRLYLFEFAGLWYHPKLKRILCVYWCLRRVYIVKGIRSSDLIERIKSYLTSILKNTWIWNVLILDKHTLIFHS